MVIYTNNNNTLSEVHERSFKFEKEIQKIFEGNLNSIMELEVVKSEFSIKHKRIDTLAFDREAKAFVIIEYKRDRSHSVVDQGISYLNLMLEHKADFIVEYNEAMENHLKRNEVDWSQSKVCFVSTSFTDNQKLATNFKDLAIELWEIKQFENGLIVIDSIKKSQSAPSIKQISGTNETLDKVTKEIKVYTEEDLLERGSDESRQLYEQFKNAILNLDADIEIQPKKEYAAFKKGKNITDITIMRKGIKMWINLKKGMLDDPKKLMRDMSNKGHWGNGDYELTIETNENVEYIMYLIKQAL